MTDTMRLPSGCYAGTIRATASVTDDDTGTGTSGQRTFDTQDVYTAAWKEPIKDNERNIAKYGNWFGQARPCQLVHGRHDHLADAVPDLRPGQRGR